jgi:hypothetical protein
MSRIVFWTGTADITLKAIIMDRANVHVLADNIGDVVHKGLGVALRVIFVGGIVGAIRPKNSHGIISTSSLPPD